MDVFVRRHQEALYGFALRYTGNATLAREIAQETFVRAWLRAASFRPDSKATVKTWLYAIALNLARDEARRRSRWGRIFIWFDETNGHDPAPETSDLQTLPPDIHADGHERLEALQSAIARLPEKLRAPLVLCALEGLSQNEAAVVLGTTRKGVEQRIQRARAKLRDCLQGS